MHIKNTLIRPVERRIRAPGGRGNNKDAGAKGTRRAVASLARNPRTTAGLTHGSPGPCCRAPGPPRRPRSSEAPRHPWLPRRGRWSCPPRPRSSRALPTTPRPRRRGGPAATPFQRVRRERRPSRPRGPPRVCRWASGVAPGLPEGRLLPQPPRPASPARSSRAGGRGTPIHGLRGTTARSVPAVRAIPQGRAWHGEEHEDWLSGAVAGTRERGVGPVRPSPRQGRPFETPRRPDRERIPRVGRKETRLPGAHLAFRIVSARSIGGGQTWFSRAFCRWAVAPRRVLHHVLGSGRGRGTLGRRRGGYTPTKRG